MNASDIDSLEFSTQGLKGELRRDEPMSKHTSWRVGGPAKWFYTPAGVDDLGMFLQRIPAEMPLAWCGLGSNLLVRDGGFSGAVIHTLKGLGELRACGNDGIYAQAGVPGAKVARYAVKRSLCGAEFLVGIPGTVGGALAMNAGCFGSETWDIVSYVETISRTSARRRLMSSQVEFGYRFAQTPESEWYVGAMFQLSPCDADFGKKAITRLLRQRSSTQPVQTSNAGSVFRNPPDDFAARLVESAGLKGHSIGNARVSPKHANFIENPGNATAAEIESLIDLIRKRVRSAHGIELTPEVSIIGNAAKAAS